MIKPRNRTFPAGAGWFKDCFMLTDYNTFWALEVKREALGTKREVRKQAIAIRDWLNEVIEYLGE